MFQAPDYTQAVSVRLSEVLADIGVDERIVLKRRRSWLLNESIITRSLQLPNMGGSVNILGSQSESATTQGLCSDTDQLVCFSGINVIQDWSNWRFGVRNYLMIQDESVSPGYCLLQLLRDDVPLPYNYVPYKHHFRDSTGRILVRNTIMHDQARGVRHGPAHTHQGYPLVHDMDIVGALRCNTWSLQARQWLNQQGVCPWPSEDMKRYCSNTGCFVVDVGGKGSEKEDFEWRISTSLAERCLNFNLNITQIRCYVLMKMILKSNIKPHYGDTISSFMCKTVLFQLIANTHSNIRRETNLLVCLSLCLFVLHRSIVNEYWRHFIIPRNNLMTEHLFDESKPQILEILQYIINGKGKALLGIKFDGLGAKLLLKPNSLCPVKISGIVSGHLLNDIANVINICKQSCLDIIRNSSYEGAIHTLLRYIFKLVIISNQCKGLDIIACKLLAKWFCTTLGSVLTTRNIAQYETISAEALRWISLGLNTDVSSSKLKLASLFYSIGDSTEILLRYIERSYDQNIVEPICGCQDYIHTASRKGFDEISDNDNDKALQYATASCVIFLQSEINCIPTELQYEMFRSIEEDLPFRDTNEEWMDYAVVDSLPFLYCLQYMTYCYLKKPDDMKRALSKFSRIISQETNLGHRETALNLLGQCMEQEDRAIDALHCYSYSLNLRRRNNAAKIHICRLLSTMVNDQARNQSLQ